MLSKTVFEYNAITQDNSALFSNSTNIRQNRQNINFKLYISSAHYFIIDFFVTYFAAYPQVYTVNNIAKLENKRSVKFK